MLVVVQKGEERVVADERWVLGRVTAAIAAVLLTDDVVCWRRGRGMDGGG